MKNARVNKSDKAVEEQVAIPEIMETVAENKIGVSEKLTEFFNALGTADEIEEDLWDMFQGAISNPDLPTEHHDNARLAFCYRMLTELLRNIEPSKN